MNRDELINLKNRLLGSKCYVAISIDGHNFFINSDPMTIGEIQSKVNTDSVIQQYEDAIEKTLISGTTNGDDITGILAPVDINFFCEVETAKVLLDKSREANKADTNSRRFAGEIKTDEEYSVLKQERDKKFAELEDFINTSTNSGNILSDYVMISTNDILSVELRELVRNDELSIIERGRHSDVADAETIVKANGIVNCNDFLIKLADLGYLWEPAYYSSFKNGITAENAVDMLTETSTLLGFICVDLINRKKDSER